MGKWNKTWLGNIDRLIDLKVPVDKQFSGLQKFTSELDDAEALSDELLEIKEKALALVKERDRKVAEMKQLVSSIKSKVDNYDKARLQLLKVMAKDENDEGEEACKSLGIALNQIEALVKDPAAMKFDITVK
ncbi:MAG: hypothetical protein AB7Q97_05255 [Gammaproteobacteria bacterium]